MITLLILVLLIGTIVVVLSTGCIVLLDPVIAILAIYGIYRLVKHFTKNKK